MFSPEQEKAESESEDQEANVTHIKDLCKHRKFTKNLRNIKNESFALIKGLECCARVAVGRLKKMLLS